MVRLSIDCRCCINRLRLHPRPDRRRDATGRHVIVVVIVNVALEGREEQTAATTRLRPRPFPPRDPPSRFERCRQRTQDSAREREEGITPTMGGADALFAPVLVLLPLLAMPPFNSVAAAAAATTTTTIKNKGNGGSGGSLVAAAAWLAQRWRRR